ncbi:hypothetical protein PIIN_06389 [Serendipita indica DSM 11827]|uniref:Cytochrome P450 n=1 Tax=Serendipita indica (strain DSM 11827) TaxID=1109443 RepID=G4TMB0_SERID|nr:hypothetical protein PIIN_06389 [Serendipita indica DSM 11827]
MTNTSPRLEPSPLDQMDSVVSFMLPGVVAYVAWRTYSVLKWQQDAAYGKDKDTIRVTPLLWGDTILYTRNIDILRQVAGGGSNRTFIKPEWGSEGMMIFGRNLVSENLDDWRRHRRIMQPAFNTKTYDLVWQDTIKTYKDMVKTEAWPTTPGQSIDIPSIGRYTYKLGLYVIAAIGLGVRFDWATPPTPPGQKKGLHENIQTLEHFYILLIIFSKKLLNALPINACKQLMESYNSVKTFIQSEIHVRRDLVHQSMAQGDTENESLRLDVFTRLILSNEMEGKYPLSDPELIGSVYMLLLAGHDTTSATIIAACAQLAVHPDIQAKIYEEVQSLGDNWTFESYSKLRYTLQVFVEASRLYPAGFLALRSPLEDTVVRVPAANSTRQPSQLALPKDSAVCVDFIGVHYNPNVFPDPMRFNPSRWDGVGEDHFTTFSTGPRQCLGKKFAMTEGVAFLASLIKDYRIAPLLKAGETVEQWKDRSLNNIKMLLTLSIKDAPLVLTRR